MSRNTVGGGKRAILEQLRVQLIPVPECSANGKNNKLAVQHLLSLMIADLHKRGRPKKDDGEAHAA